VHDLLMTRRHHFFKPSPLLGFQSPELFVHRSQACICPTHLCLQVRRESGTVPEPGGFQALQEGVAWLQADTLGHAQCLDAVPVPRALLLEPLSCPVQPSGVFCLDTGHVHYAPAPLCPVMVTEQQP
jgi:hypothetical protein